MIDRAFAEHFAQDWIDSWNSHDLGRILSHYADDFEMSSPRIIVVAEEPSGVLKGKSAVGTYWAKALDLAPDLHFDLIATFLGINSIVLHFNGVRGQCAEAFHFDENGEVCRSSAHYL